MKKVIITLAFALPFLSTLIFIAGCVQPARHYEVWIIDQADAAKGGAKLYIYDHSLLESGISTVQPEVVDLNASAQGVGNGPGVRPHLVIFNNAQTHAMVANVASGHVYFVNAESRKVVASIDVGEQAHAAYASPDDSIVLVANQNGKKLARIKADFKNGNFSYNTSEDLDLKALEDPAHPDNAPICPIIFTDGGKKAYVTLRGGGLFIVDTASTPMKVVKSYGKDQVAPAGCGGIAAGKKIYVNSGTANSSDLYVFDSSSDSLVKHIDVSGIGSDGHGLVLAGKDKRYLWMGNRASANIAVIDTKSDSIVGTINDVGKAPDIMDRTPDGERVFVALRGPNNLTGGAVAKGEKPGLAVMRIKDGGASGVKEMFVPLGDQTPQSPVDPHSLAVRVVKH